MEKKKKTGKFYFAEEKSYKSLLLQLLDSLKAHIRVKSSRAGSHCRPEL